jgi:two-component system chemotaxis response regulator CheY
MTIVTDRNIPVPADRPGYVLVVDNNARDLVFMAMVLQRVEYHVCSAHSATTALEMANVSPPSLIITAMNLRGMSGVELIQEIRKEPRTRDIPVIIMADTLTPEIERKCRAAAAAGCLAKPVLADELYRMVHPIIEPGSRRRHIRIQTRLTVAVDDKPLDCAEGECASMLSANGMYIQTLKHYPLDTLVRIRIALDEQTVLVEARVIYCHTYGEGPFGTPGIGLQFLKITPQGREIIRRFINDELTHGLAPGWA